MKYASAARAYVKYRPWLRSYLVWPRWIWRRLNYVYLLLGQKGERNPAVESMPFLGDFSRGSCSLEKEMRAAFIEYTDTVSYEGMPISFESACFLWSLCEALKPERILDMGSGFSSFVFRRYQVTAGLKPEIWSVDESAEWLEKTGEYLRSHGLSDQDLYTWDAFQSLQPPKFDLIFHDLGYMNERPDILERLLTLKKEDGVIIVDDFQNPVYRAEIDRRFRRHERLESHSLRWLTLDKFLRYCLLVRGGPKAPSHDLYLDCTEPYSPSD